MTAYRRLSTGGIICVAHLLLSRWIVANGYTKNEPYSQRKWYYKVEYGRTTLYLISNIGGTFWTRKP
jgi:hypothetical protein